MVCECKKDGTTDLQDEILGQARRADSGLVGCIRQILAKCQGRVASAAYPLSSFHQQMEVLEAGARLIRISHIPTFNSLR